MKTRLSWVMLCVVFVFTSQLRLAAQSCFTYTNNYATYNSVSYDGNSIYTSVTTDGQGQMNFTGGNGCGSINYGNAQHTPYAVNVISIPGTNTYVGGQQNGAPECPNCYLSVTNSQSMTATLGTTYAFTAAGGVGCNFGGTIFGASFPTFDFNLSVAYGSRTGTGTDPQDEDPIGYYTAACSSGRLVCPASGNWAVEFGKGETPPLYIKTPGLALYVNGALWGCVQDPISSTATGPGPCR